MSAMENQWKDKSLTGRRIVRAVRAFFVAILYIPVYPFLCACFAWNDDEDDSEEETRW